ncbi:MAG: hypothetical protein C0391_02535 [Anaerolinea sp.]|nr:hypothetical protein [Anaerolinea sp.]
MNIIQRSKTQKIIDTIAFPLRAFTIFEEDKWGLSSLRTDRCDYCAGEVQGYTLDVGCGPDNWFIHHNLQGNGIGIDVFKYRGLSDENIVEDITHFPFPDAAFDTVTFIANLNHVPRSQRDIELAEAYRVLKPGGNILVTMTNALALLVVHRVVEWYDRIFKTRHDMDNIRGMGHEEEYYLKDEEIRSRLHKAGFTNLQKKRFPTVWGLNWVTIGWKKDQNLSQ